MIIAYLFGGLLRVQHLLQQVHYFVENNKILIINIMRIE
jgi:hypothetical protein